MNLLLFTPPFTVFLIKKKKDIISKREGKFENRNLPGALRQNSEYYRGVEIRVLYRTMTEGKIKVLKSVLKSIQAYSSVVTKFCSSLRSQL